MVQKMWHLDCFTRFVLVSCCQKETLVNGWSFCFKKEGDQSFLEVWVSTVIRSVRFALFCIYFRWALTLFPMWQRFAQPIEIFLNVKQSFKDCTFGNLFPHWVLEKNVKLVFFSCPRCRRWLCTTTNSNTITSSPTALFMTPPVTTPW